MRGAASAWTSLVDVCFRRIGDESQVVGAPMAPMDALQSWHTSKMTRLPQEPVI